MAKSEIIHYTFPEADNRNLKLVRVQGETETIYRVMYDREDSGILGIMGRDESGYWEFWDRGKVEDWLILLEPQLAQLIVINGDV